MVCLTNSKCVTAHTSLKPKKPLYELWAIAGGAVFRKFEEIADSPRWHCVVTAMIYIKIDGP
jgi:hypothetical protein